MRVTVIIKFRARDKVIMELGGWLLRLVLGSGLGSQVSDAFPFAIAPSSGTTDMS